MTKDELRQLFSAAGWSCQTKREEVVLEVCYFCGNQKHNLEASASKGVFHCWACKRGGRLSELIEMLTGQQVYIPVQRGEQQKKINAPATVTDFKSLSIAMVPSAATYLARRGIPPEVAAQYGVVVCVEPGHRLEGRLALQLRDFWTGELAGWVGRSYTGKQPKYISTLVRKVITGWRTRDRATTAVVVEGPLDGLSAHRAGFQSAVLSGVGSAGVIDWAARVDPQAQIVIMLDQEAEVQAKQLYWQMLPVVGDRLRMVEYSEAGQDPAQVGPDGVRDLVARSLRGRGQTI